MSLTTDPNAPCLNTPKGEGQQNKCYLILSEEERAKGFVRPYRDTYVHVGKDVKSWWKGIHHMITEEERKEEGMEKYVAVMTVLTNKDGSFKGGTYVTKEELDAWKSGKRIGGCGAETRMVKQIAETYAVDPNFYGSTWCMGCQKHIHVNEFVWKGTNETVGS